MTTIHQNKRFTPTIHLLCQGRTYSGHENKILIEFPTIENPLNGISFMSLALSFIPVILI